MLNSEDTIIRL